MTKKAKTARKPAAKTTTRKRSARNKPEATPARRGAAALADEITRLRAENAALTQAKSRPKAKPEPKLPDVEINAEDILYLLECYALELGVPKSAVLDMVESVTKKERAAAAELAAVIPTAANTEAAA